MQLGFAKAHHPIPLEEKVGVALRYGSSPKFGASPLIFLQRVKLATSNLVYSLGLPRSIIKSYPQESGDGLVLGDLPQIVGFPYISGTAGATDFKFGAQLGFANSHHKITRRKKGGQLGMALG